jgi:hypothetical protein
MVQRPSLAQPAAADPAALVGGQSRCPTPTLVWQNVVPLFPGELLVERLRALGGPTPAAVVIVDDCAISSSRVGPTGVISE